MVMAGHEDEELTKEVESVTFRGIVNELKRSQKNTQMNTAGLS